MIHNRNYLTLFGYDGPSCTTNELWRHLVSSLPELTGPGSPWRGPLETILNAGPLARRIVRALERKSMSAVYGDLSRCLETGKLYGA